MEATTKTFVQYDESVESIGAEEQQVTDQLAASMRNIAKKLGDQFRHTMRPLHAKSHGALKAVLSVYDNLPEPYRQGLFAEPAEYGAIVRLSTVPGDILPDSVSSPRGFALKVIGVNGPVLPGHEGHNTQDFLFVNDPVFGAKNAAEFLKTVAILEQHAQDSTALKQVVAATTRTIESAIEVVGAESGTLKALGGHPLTHILSETFYTQTAFRFGDYIAKLSVAPLSDNLRALTHKHLEHASHESSLRDAVLEFFATETAEWEIRVQLCANLEHMPVEDPTVKWSEEESPFVPVARLVAPPQNSYSAERRVYVDEILSFNPWHGLAVHQPLGNINRARKLSYPTASQFRHTQEQRPMIEPKSLVDFPD